MAEPTLEEIAEDLRTIANEVDNYKPPQPIGFTAYGLLHASGWPVDASSTATMAAIWYGESGGFLDAVGDYWQVLEFYEVRRGDSLSSIARWLKLPNWNVLYEANLDVVGPDPNKLEPGMMLRNPGLAENANVWRESLGVGQVRALKEPLKYPQGRWRDAHLLKDPIHQGKAAWAISSGGENFTPWSIFNNGSYQKYLGRDFPLLVGHERAGLWPQTEVLEYPKAT